MRQLSVGRAWAALVFGSACTAGLGADVLVEAESFSDRGGWVVDQQFVDIMGSPYVLVHGMGTPVANAVTTVQFPAAGDYTLWVRTKDWVPPHHPGTFKVIVGGTELAAEFGKGVRGDELPEELRFRRKCLAKIKEAMAALEAEAKAQADARRAEIAEKEGKRGEGPRPGRKPKPPSDEPAEKAQRNFTDPDSRIMKDGATKSFEQCYNCEAVVDTESQVIAAADVTQEANDKKQVVPMVEQVKANAGEAPEKLSADSDFYSEANVKYLEGEGVDAYVATEKMKHPVGSTTLSGRRGGEKGPPPRGRIPRDATTKQLTQAQDEEGARDVLEEEVVGRAGVRTDQGRARVQAVLVERTRRRGRSGA